MGRGDLVRTKMGKMGVEEGVGEMRATDYLPLLQFFENGKARVVSAATFQIFMICSILSPPGLKTISSSAVARHLLTLEGGNHRLFIGRRAAF